jgi:malate dehydrogenase (oxaloacetate-decarboxylating)(NADP+)
MHPRMHLQAIPAGTTLLQTPLLNKGTAFTAAERDRLGLRGLLPPHVNTMADQAARVMENFGRKTDDLERYVHLASLQDRNETLFYRLLVDHVEKLMPVVYTPTVGRACQTYGHIFRRPRGLFISLDDLDHIDECVANWPMDDVRVIVVTDGERILGLGDLGTHGMGIPVGKLSLYTALAGIHPSWCLPVTLDAGTDNQELLDDPLYIGLRRKRERGPDYDRLVDGFIAAALRRWPGTIIQFEDFGNRNAFKLLDRWKDRIRCFNDDIQGTAAVTLAGLLSAVRMAGTRLEDSRILFLGAGEAGLGTGDLIAHALMARGVPAAEARRVSWFVDSKGLVVRSRTDLNHEKQAFAHEGPAVKTLAEAIEVVKPTAIVGVSGQPATFTQAILDRMGELNRHPIVFALSNPTSKAECTAEQAWMATGGRAIFASGSPFPNCTIDGRTLIPSQCNNAYIFPGVGLGVIASGARRIDERLFITAAEALAGLCGPGDFAEGRILPPLSRIREVSRVVARAVAEEAWRNGTADQVRPEDPAALIDRLMWDPAYPLYAGAGTAPQCRAKAAAG